MPILKPYHSTIIKKIIDACEFKEGEADISESIRRGMCFALSVEWLRAIHEKIQGWDKDYGTENHYNAKPKYYMQIARNFQTYIRTDKNSLTRLLGTNTVEADYTAFASLMTGNIFEECYALKIPGAGHITTPDVFAEQICRSSNYLLMYMRLKKGAHAVAAYFDKNKRTVYFYDPNCGVVSFSSEDLDDLEAQLKEFLTKWWKEYEGEYTIQYVVPHMVIPSK
ncbi:YopT-type cysteine protease domain-containing protein [Pseudobutyrivibrio sp.]|jgi:hypothetical protein|uniref:YopT-type cysteine protease domain-containing protein n=1 Tax=Pseudobutyrivibrio sp. TaxID=2014367 RepID=UPI0025FDCCE0|nr:YopT-type cysteine protease domain-containing protein [Pseudobutyrivibrio sp.]